jgi:aspartate racemase
MLFEEHVHRAAQSLLPQRANAGYPPMLVAYLRGALVGLDAQGTPLLPPRPDDGVLETAALLGRASDFLVLVSNGAHRFRREVERAAGKPVLDMISLALDEVERRGWRTVGVVSYFEPRIYAEPLAARSLLVETIGPEIQADLDAAIFRVMEGRIDPDPGRAAPRAIAELRARGVDGIILGCTEIPFLLPEEAGKADCLDPLPLLAEAAVRFASSTGA